MNEMYAKDISRKVRDVRTCKAKEGKFISSIPSYGYMRSPDDRLKLVVDPTTGPIFQRAFSAYDSGDSALHISDKLNAEGTLSPCAYYYASTGKDIPKRYRDRSMKWTSASLLQMFQNPVYLGATINNKRKALSYKNKQKVSINPEDWIVVENTHEPLVSREMWDRVQSRIKKEKKKKSTRINSTGEVSLFSGVLRCADCGAPMAYNHKVYKGVATPIYRCTGYAMHGKSVCSPHSIKVETLSAAVLLDIQQNACLLSEEKAALVEKLKNHLGNGRDKELVSRKNRLKQMQTRLEKLNKITKQLYEDRVDGIFTLEEYSSRVEEYREERMKLTTLSEDLKCEIMAMQNDEQNIEQWVRRIEALADIQTLDRATIVSLIDTITVYDKRLNDGIMEQNIEIAYKFVGCLDLQ